MTIRQLAIGALVVAGLTVAVRAQNAPPSPPSGPFKAVHLLNLKSDAEVAAMQGSIAEQNAVIAKMGVKDTRYRLYKIAGTQAGQYAYLMESSWPSGDVYKKVHDNPDWQAAGRKYPLVETIMKTEVYNRYVEVPAKK